MNHKVQAFILTCLLFSPLLLFAMLDDAKPVQIKGEQSITLVMSNFIAQGQVQNAPNPAPPAPDELEQPKPKEEKKEVKKEKPRKHDKYAKKVLKKEKKFEKPVEESKPSSPPAGAQIANNAPTQIGTLAYGKSDDPFLRAVKKAIDEAAAQSYPRQARKMNLSGEVLLEFVWLENMKLDKVRILRSSGHNILDKNVLKVIHKAAQNFPPYQKNVRIQIPIVYNLK